MKVAVAVAAVFCALVAVVVGLAALSTIALPPWMFREEYEWRGTVGARRGFPVDPETLRGLSLRVGSTTQEGARYAHIAGLYAKTTLAADGVKGIVDDPAHYPQLTVVIDNVDVRWTPFSYRFDADVRATLTRDPAHPGDGGTLDFHLHGSTNGLNSRDVILERPGWHFGKNLSKNLLTK